MKLFRVYVCIQLHLDRGSIRGKKFSVPSWRSGATPNSGSIQSCAFHIWTQWKRRRIIWCWYFTKFQSVFNQILHSYIYRLNVENVFSKYYIALATFPGTSLKQFKKDPVNNIRSTLGMQKRQDGYEIAQKAHHHYFVGKTKRSCLIPTQYADVINNNTALSLLITFNLAYLNWYDIY